MTIAAFCFYMFAISVLVGGLSTVISRNPVQRHKANVMTVMRVFRAGISKTNKKFHDALYRCMIAPPSPLIDR